MCCDIRVAAEDAQLGQPEIKLGLIPGGGGTQRLPRLVGLGRAMLLNMTGDFIDGRTAYEWGLVERVVPRDEVHEAALEIARTIAARSPVAIGVLRELARTTRDLPLEEGLRREAEGFRRCLASDDGLEGVTAFLEKREPRVHGALEVTLPSMATNTNARRRESGRPRRHGRAGEPRPPRAPRPRARRGPGPRRRSRGRDQLRGRSHPHGQLPADAGAPDGSRIGGRRRRRRPARARIHALARRRIREQGARRAALAASPARERELRGGRGIPARLPHGLDPAHGARPDRLRLARPRDRGGRRCRDRCRPAREGAERTPDRCRRQRGEARAHALARRGRGRDVRAASASSSRWTSSSTSSGETSSRPRSGS